MNFKKTISHLITLPAVASLAAVPLLASPTPHAGSPVDDVLPGAEVRLIYPRLAQGGIIEIPTEEPLREEEGDDNEDARQEYAQPVLEFTDEITTEIVVQISQIGQICDAVDDAYQVSCFSRMYRELAEDLSSRGDYAETKEILLDTADKLDRIVRKDRDRSKPPVRATLTTPTGAEKTTPPIVAVKPEAVQTARAEAAEVMAEAETVLLRSASSDSKRAIHYQRIAAAVGSNKVLLRSA